VKAGLSEQFSFRSIVAQLGAQATVSSCDGTNTERSRLSADVETLRTFRRLEYLDLVVFGRIEERRQRTGEA
jgi:hypothetical protein